jgi:succinyl-diaminopimelate desuccinylase
MISGEINKLASSLIRVDTTNPPGRERAAAELVARYLTSNGVDVKLDRFGHERANLVARIPGRSGEGLLFCGHLDTVPAEAGEWTVNPNAALVKGGYLYGRGACDMKGAVAAMAVVLANLALLETRPSADMVLALTAGEEVDGCGARRLVDAGVLEGIASIVMGEPTRLDIGTGHRGALWLEVETKGVAAHSSQPDVGRNAVMLMLDWLQPFTSIEELAGEEVDEDFGRGTVSLNLVNGGGAPNVVPDRCRAVLDFRTLPQQRHSSILAKLEARRPRARLSVLRDCVAISLSRESSVRTATIDAVREVLSKNPIERTLPYVTDGSVFAEATKAPIIVFGPGDERLAHQVDERVLVGDLVKAAECYKGIARRLLYNHTDSHR